MIRRTNKLIQHIGRITLLALAVISMLGFFDNGNVFAASERYNEEKGITNQNFGISEFQNNTQSKPNNELESIPGPQPYSYGDTTTWLGSQYGRDNVNRVSDRAYIDFAEDVIVDHRNGDFYVADTYNNTVRRITSDNITTFAGSGSYGDLDGPRADAELAQPRGIAISSTGVVAIADTLNNKVKKVSSGSVSTLADSDDLSGPEGVVFSGSRIYIADTGHDAIKYIDVNGGTVSTLTSGSHIDAPKKIAISDDGNTLYVAAHLSHKLVSVSISTGAQTVVAGSGENRYEEGTGAGASFQNLWGVAFYGSSLYVSDGDGTDDRVRKIDLTTGTTSIFAADSNMITLNYPAGIAVYGSSVYVANSGLGTVRALNKTDGSDLGVYIGSDRFGNNDGRGTSAGIGRPYDIAMSSSSSDYMYLAENNKISRIQVSTGQRTGLWGNSIDNYREETGDVGRASTISSIAVSSDGTTIYFADTWNNRIRKVDVATRTSSWISGTGSVNTTGSGNGYREGGADVAKFDNPRGIALSNDGNYLYVSDTSNRRIRKVRISDGYTWHIAGSGDEGFKDGGGSVARFNRPFDIAIDENDHYLYLADSYNHRIRKIDVTTGNVTTLAGAGRSGYRDGNGIHSVFSVPEYVEYVDGYLYVSEAGGQKIRRINVSTADVTTVASTGGGRGYHNGNKDQAEFNNPKGMEVIGNTMYVADTWNDVIRTVSLSGSSTTPTPDDPPAPGFSFMAYASNVRGGFYGAACDLRGDSKAEIISGTSEGLGPQIAVFDSEGNVLVRFFAYASHLRSGVRVACADVNGDGRNEIVTAPGPGGRPHIRVFDGNGSLVNPGFFALDGLFKGGANLATGDVDNDGTAEIIVGASPGGGPHITVHDVNGNIKGNFMAYATSFRNGIRVAVGDFDGNGEKEIITGPETGSPHIQTFTGTGHRINPGFYAYDANFKGGVSVAGGDVNGDGQDDIIIGEGTTGQPHQSTVKMFDEKGDTIYTYFKAYAASFTGGVNVFSDDTDGDGKDEVLVSPMSNGGPNIRIINPDEL